MGEVIATPTPTDYPQEVCGGCLGFLTGTCEWDGDPTDCMRQDAVDNAIASGEE